MKFIKNTIIATLCLLLLTTGIYLLIHKFVFSISKAADVLFVVGILVFLPAVNVHLGAYRIMHSFSYFARSLLNKDFKKNYPTFADYRDEKDGEVNKKISLVIVAASGIILLAAIIISFVIL